MDKNIDKNEFFKEVTLRISSSLDVDEALSNLLEYLNKIIPMEFMMLNYHGDDGGIYLLSHAGEYEELNELIKSNSNLPLGVISKDKADLAKKELRKRNLVIGEVAIMNQPVPGFLLNLMQEIKGEDFNNPPSHISVRLSINDIEVGSFGLFHREENIYTREHADLLNLVIEPIAIAMSNARQFREISRLKEILADDNRAMSRELERISGAEVIGSDFGLRQVMEMVRQVSSLNNPVLLLGETGTGKEVIANVIHQISNRRDNTMVRVQCGAIPDSLLDSELFGHEKGAFTGALSQKRGRFERADKGTIFLDEIGELSLDAQVKLLRVLQEHEIERLGGSKTINVDVRVIAATHRNLEEMVRQGSFREDLWYRLNVFPIRIPPLRERKEDIHSLVTHFINNKSRTLGLARIPLLLPNDIGRLKQYDWPGNVRELQNVIERALITSTGENLIFPELGIPEDVAPQISQASGTGRIEPLEKVISDHIKLALSQARGKIEGKSGAAKMLDMNPSTLRAKMRKLGIPFGRKAEIH